MNRSASSSGPRPTPLSKASASALRAGLLGLFAVAGPGSLPSARRLDLGGKLLELLRERRPEALHLRGGTLAVPGEVELLGQLLLRELLDRRLSRLDRLDLQSAVVLQAGGRRNQLADDHVLLQTHQAIPLALQGSVGEHLGGLLEG